MELGAVTATRGGEGVGSFPYAGKTKEVRDLSSLVTKVPEGFQTVPGWWATMEGEAVDLLRNPLSTFIRDADALEAICETENLPFLWIDAPKAFKEWGRGMVRAYPVTLLEEFYPAEP